MTYNRALVEHLLPSVWDKYAAYGGKRNPLEPDMEMRSFRSRPNPKNGNNLPAYLADIRNAWAKTPLTLRERQAVLLRHALDLEWHEIGHLLDVTKQSAAEAGDRGVGRMAAWLNGDPYDPNYDIESEAVASEL